MFRYLDGGMSRYALKMEGLYFSETLAHSQDVRRRISTEDYYTIQIYVKT